MLITKIKVAPNITWRISNLQCRLDKLGHFLLTVKDKKECLLILDDDLELNYDPVNSLDTILVDWDGVKKHHSRNLPVNLVIKSG
jgi:hypothetical protein